MDNTAFLTGKQIRLKQKAITALLAILATGEYDRADIQQAYTLFNNIDEFHAYIGEIYTEAPEVSFIGSSGDTPAAATAVLTDGIVTEVIVTVPGSYASVPEVVFSDEFGNGAAAVAVLSSGDTVASVTVLYQSLVARLVAKSLALDIEFEGL